MYFKIVSTRILSVLKRLCHNLSSIERERSVWNVSDDNDGNDFICKL